MSNIKYVVNVESGEVSEIEMTEEELAIEAEDRAKREAIEKAEQTKAEIKTATRQAILDRLGLTEDEAKILLG